MSARIELDVRSAARRLGYRPNAVARSLRMQRTMTLGAVFHRLDSPFVADLLDSIDHAVQVRGFSLVTTNAGGDPDLFPVLARRLIERGVDGLFVHRPSGIASLLDEPRRVLPVLAVFSRGDEAALPVVTGHGGETTHAVRRLAALGHRAITYLTTPLEADDRRGDLMRAAAGRAGVGFGLHANLDDRDEGRSRAALSAVLSGPDRPTAVFVRYRHVPLVLRVLRDLGLEVPGDISLVSFGDSPWLEVVDPPIAALSTDGEALGRAAAAAMLEWIAGTPPPPVTEAGEAIWIERRSVGAAPAASAPHRPPRPGMARTRASKSAT